MDRITASCTIAGHVVRRNGTMLFEDKGASDAGAFLLSAYTRFGLNYPRFYKMDNLSKLGWLASEVLLYGGPSQDTTGTPSAAWQGYRPEEVGLLLTNANASLDTDLKYFETVKDIPSPALFGYTLPNIMIGEICIRNNFKGENTFYVTDGFDAGLIGQQVGLLLDQDILKACICGWVDLLGNDYRAALFLVERTDNEGGPTEDKGTSFTKTAMEKIFSI